MSTGTTLESSYGNDSSPKLIQAQEMEDLSNEDFFIHYITLLLSNNLASKESPLKTTKNFPNSFIIPKKVERKSLICLLHFWVGVITSFKTTKIHFFFLSMIVFITCFFFFFLQYSTTLAIIIR